MRDAGVLLDSQPRAATAAPWWIRLDGRASRPTSRSSPGARRCDPAETRARLGIASDRAVRARVIQRRGSRPALRCDRRNRTPDHACAPEREPPAPLTYPDLVAAADVVVSKPGYGIVSECVANGTRAALHLARTLRRARRVRRRDAAGAALPLSRTRRISCRPVGRRGPRRCSRRRRLPNGAGLTARGSRREAILDVAIGDVGGLGSAIARSPNHPITNRLGLLLDAGDERPEPGEVHLLDRHGMEIGLGDETRADPDPT